MVTTRPLVVCMVGVMCASVAPPAEGFTPPGCFARAHNRAADSFYWSERRLVVAASATSSSSSSSCSSSSSSSSPNPSRGSALAARAGLCGGALRGPTTAARGRRRGSGSLPQTQAGRRHLGGSGGAGRDRGGRGGGGRGVRMMSAAGSGRGGEGEGRHQRQQQHLQLQKQKQQQQQKKKGLSKKKQQQQQQQLSRGEGVDAPHALSDPFRRKQQQQQEQQDSEGNSNTNTNTNTNTNINNSNQQQKQPPQQGMEASLPPPPSSSSSTSSSSTTSSSSSSSSSDPLALYFKTLRKFSQLNKDEEVVLGRKIQRGIRCERLRDRLETRDGVAPTYDEWAAALNITREELYHELDTAEKAKRHMISANLRLVVSISRRYQFRGMSFPDLIQEGTMGLVKASEKFNPELGFKFCTYATWWIKQSLMTGIANQSRIIRLPASVHDFLNSVRKYTIELTVDGKLPTDQELGDKLGATVEKIQYYRRAAISTDSLSLDARVGGGSGKSGDNSDSNLGDMVGDGLSPEDFSQTTYMKGKVAALLETLDDREKRVVRSRYGLDGLDPKTLEQIGRDVGLTRERVRQIEVKALQKLRQPYRNYRLRDHGLEQLFVDAGVRQPASEAISAAKALIAKAESSAQEADSAYVGARLGLEVAKAAEPSLQGPDSAYVETRVAVGAGAGDVERPPVALTVDQHALEIESKRKSLDKAWNKDSAAAVDRLERELEKSTAALHKLEREQEEWKLSSAAAVVEEKSLSMVS